MASTEDGSSIMRREGEYWTIAHGGRLIRLRHSKGLGYLERMLREPGRSFPVLELSGRPPGPDRAGHDRDRVAVTKAIRSALRRVAEYDQVLGALLQQSVRTGARCSYVPGPGHPGKWEA